MIRSILILFLLSISLILTAQQSFDINRFSDPTKYGWNDWYDRINYRNDLMERQKLLQLYENEAQLVSVNMVKSALIPGWGQYSTREYVKGHVFLGAEIVLIGLSAFYYDRAMFNYQKYLDASHILEIENYYSKAQADYRNTIVFGSIAALVWLINIYDVIQSTESYNADVWQRIYQDYYQSPVKLTPNGIEVRF